VVQIPDRSFTSASARASPKSLFFTDDDFGAQEPGTESEIRNFCQTRYAVDFPLTAKEHVIGPAAHPLYKWLTEELGEAAAPKWNFHKYLFGRDGTIVGAFGSRTPPEAPELAAAIRGVLPQ